jgi:hypothetical protein
MENKSNRKQNAKDQAIFKHVRLDSSDNRSIRQSINLYRNSVTNIMKNFTISDGDKTIKEAPRPPKHRPTLMNVLVDGMKKYIFGSNGLYKMKRNHKSSDTKNNTAHNTHINDSKLKKTNQNLNYKKINKTRLNTEKDQKNKHSDNLFLTDSRSTKHNDTSKSRNLFPKLRLDSNFITSCTSNSFYSKTFSKKKFNKQCCDIYNDNVELYRNFTHISSSKIGYSAEEKARDYNLDREILGDIQKKYDRQEMIRHNSTGTTEFLDKRKVDLMKFGQNLDKIPDDVVLRYKTNIEQNYFAIAREADLDDMCMRVKIKGNFSKLNRNDLELKKLRKIISSQRVKYMNQ